MSRTLAVFVLTVAAATTAQAAVGNARFSSGFGLERPGNDSSVGQSSAAGTIGGSYYAGTASVTMGADEGSVPFISFNASSTDRGTTSAWAQGSMYYQWSISGAAAAGELVPVTITTLGHFSAQLTATSLRADARARASIDWLNIHLLSSFSTNSVGGRLDNRHHGVLAGWPVFGAGVGTLVDFEDLVSAPGGSVTATGSASFSETFTVRVSPNEINSIAMHARGGEGGSNWLGSTSVGNEAVYRYAMSGYIDPIITIDAAFADRFSLVQSSIPVVAVPVPEASTLAMMLGGLGLLGLAAARRRRGWPCTLSSSI